MFVRSRLTIPTSKMTNAHGRNATKTELSEIGNGRNATKTERIGYRDQNVRPTSSLARRDASACSKHCTASVLGAHATGSAGMMPFPLMSSP